MSVTLEFYTIDKLCLLIINGLQFTKTYSMALREAKKLAEEKKRERLEEKRARYDTLRSGYLFAMLLIIRERVRQQIAKDKAEREAALKKEKEATVQQQQKPSQPAVAAPAKKEYDTCRLQVSIVNINCSFSRCY